MSIATAATRGPADGVLYHRSPTKGVGVVVRLWMAMALLAAVFVMHGLQCSSEDMPVGHVMTAAHVMPAGERPMGTARAADLMPRVTPSVHENSEDAVVGALGQGGSGHDAAGHLWVVCMAVLVAAGLAALRTVCVRQPPSVLADAIPWVRLPQFGRLLLAARPPDLHALCLLRT